MASSYKPVKVLSTKMKTEMKEPKAVRQNRNEPTWKQCTATGRNLHHPLLSRRWDAVSGERLG